jgi:hypothetical protein
LAVDGGNRHRRQFRPSLRATFHCRTEELGGWVKEPVVIAKLKPMLEGAKVDAATKLPSQGTGQFYLVRERDVVPIQTDRSLIETRQLPEDRIAQIASTPSI